MILGQTCSAFGFKLGVDAAEEAIGLPVDVCEGAKAKGYQKAKDGEKLEPVAHAATFARRTRSSGVGKSAVDSAMPRAAASSSSLGCRHRGT
jgi:hypothetical protein